MIDEATVNRAIHEYAVENAIGALVLMLREQGILQTNVIDRVADSMIASFSDLEAAPERVKLDYARRIDFMMGRSGDRPPSRLKLEVIEGGRERPPL